MTRKATRKLGVVEALEARLREMWEDYRPVFPEQSFTDFMSSAPLIDDPEDVASVAAYKDLSLEDRTALIERLSV